MRKYIQQLFLNIKKTKENIQFYIDIPLEVIYGNQNYWTLFIAKKLLLLHTAVKRKIKNKLRNNISSIICLMLKKHKSIKTKCTFLKVKLRAHTYENGKKNMTPNYHKI